MAIDLDDASNELDDDEEGDPTEWPTRARAAKILGLSTRTVDRMVQSGELKTRMVRGVKRFSPRSLDECSVEHDGNAEFIETARLQNKAVETANEQNLKLWSLVFKPSEELLKLAMVENAALRVRITELEDKQVEVLEAYEKALTFQHERHLEELRVAGQQQRLDKAIDLITPHIPTLVGQLTRPAKLDALLTKLTPDAILALFEVGAIDLETRDMLLELKGVLKEKADTINVESTQKADDEQGVS